MATISNHQDLVGRGAIHPFAFVQATDPALDPTNKVAAKKAWIDTSSSPTVLKVRNAANTAWDTALGNVVSRTPVPATLLVHS